MTTKAELKQRVCEAIDQHSAEIIEIGETILRNPETGFKEIKTSRLVAEKMEGLGLNPQTGLAVTGVIKPGEQITNAGAIPGDALILTKPIGTGIITTAGKAKLAPQSVIDGAVRVMMELNAKAAEAMLEVGVHSCTDITGFGLIGHLNGMINGSKVAARIRLSNVPVFDGVWDLLSQDTAPGGTHRNLKSALPFTRWDDSISEDAKLLLCDAQTSGGLLLSVAPDKIGAMMNALEARGVMGVNIGEILESSEPYIEVVA